MLRAIVLAVALLAAQQNALAHAAWHAGSAGSQSQDQDQSRLCDLHSALGAVLGVLSGKAATAPACASPVTAFDERALPPARSSPCSPLSRGPPASL